MLNIRILITATALFAVPALAQGFSLRLNNSSSQAVSSLSLFPLDENGEAIEDNLGGFYQPVAPGKSGKADISAACGPMLALIMLENGSELRLTLNTCTETTLQVRD